MEGVMPYNIIWSNGDIGADVDQLCNGSYNATISDALGNILITDVYEILSPGAINIDGVVFDISCINMEDGEIEVSATGGAMPFDYSWDNNQTGNKIDHLSSGTYIVTVIDENDCINTSEFTLADIDLVNLNLEISAFDCDEDLTTLTINGDNMYNYPIYVDGEERTLEPGNTIGNIAPGMHTISYQINEDCIVLIDEIDILNPNDYEIELNINAAHVSKGSLLRISLDIINNELLNEYSIEWQSINSYECVETLANDACVTIELIVDQAELLEVLFTDSRGCTKKLSVDISLVNIIDVYIPNIFSPNGDGNQDYFEISTNAEGLIVNRFIIYDRWGNNVYSTKAGLLSELVAWDGMIKSKQANIGVYVFLLELTTVDGEKIFEVGDITLIR
jgi:gliding motility-associated-like protein